MRKIEAQTVQAVKNLIFNAKFSGRYFKSGNMEVSQDHTDSGRIVSVRLHGNEICAIRPDSQHIWLSDCGYQTRTTKGRLNVLLLCFSRGFRIYQKNFDWFLSGYGGEDVSFDGFESVPLSMDHDGYGLQLAAKIA